MSALHALTSYLTEDKRQSSQLSIYLHLIHFYHLLYSSITCFLLLNVSTFTDDSQMDLIYFEKCI
jgi:hypothetical protein